MKKHLHTSSRLALIAICMVCMFVSCKPEETHINVSTNQLVGLWKKSSTNEYWRYNSDGTGATWDADDDISEVETNFSFKWSLDEDVVTHVFTGRMNNQYVPKSYTITAIDSKTMKWRDLDYDYTYILQKVTSQS
ncbi:MAG: lipocalin family protein [Bacteroidales bacterium]|nr:lipocalin family protein [Bacteroidales bacterium]